MAEVNSDSLPESIEAMQAKMDLFIEETVPEFTIRDLLSRLIEKYMESFSNAVCCYID